jgi:ubiquinol-cytochrome c reductase cytochrome c1 subunit
MAKDVVEFLNWTAEPEMDDRKKMGWKVLAVTSVLFAISVWVKRCATPPSNMCKSRRLTT